MLPSFIDWLNYTDQTAGGMQQGAVAALIFLFGLLLVWILPRYKWWLAAGLLVLVTPLATGGYWFSEQELGISDWDYYFSLHTSHRNTLLTYHALPHWNPYTCGGTAGIADPEFRFFTPTFLLQLAFGIPVGFRLAIFLATATGAVGMLMLGKRLGLSVYGALVAAIGVAFSTVNLLEITEGHPNIFAAMYIPWIFWAWLSAYRANSKNQETRDKQNQIGKSQKSNDHFTILRIRIWNLFVSWKLYLVSSRNFWSLVTGIFLTLTFFQGGIYLLMYTIIAFIGLLFLVQKPSAALTTSVAAGLWALSLAAVKLIPVLFWLSQFQDEAYVSSTYILPYLDKVLLGRILHGSREVIPNQVSGWHEYGAYIGPVILTLAFLGLLRYHKRRVVRALLIAAAAATLLASSGPVLKPVFDVVPIIPRSNISRFMLFAVIPLSLLAGFGLDSIPRPRNRKVLVTGYRLLITSIVALAALDLFTLTYPLSQQAFVVPRLGKPPAPAPSPIAYTTSRYEFNYSPSETARKAGIHEPHTRAYEATLQGYGTLSYCSVLTPTPAVGTIHDEYGNEIIAFENKEGKTGSSFRLLAWSPNRVQVEINVPAPSTVFLNANYARGWFVNGLPAVEAGNRVATQVPAGVHQLTFEYKTRGFSAGVLISLTTVAAAAYVVYRHYSLAGTTRK